MDTAPTITDTREFDVIHPLPGGLDDVKSSHGWPMRPEKARFDFRDRDRSLSVLYIHVYGSRVKKDGTASIQRGHVSFTITDFSNAELPSWLREHFENACGLYNQRLTIPGRPIPPIVYRDES